MCTLVAVVLAQLAWITFLPIFQTPDEQAHFGQVQVVAETGNDFIPPSNVSKELYTAEDTLGALRNNRGDNKYTYHSEFNINYSPTVFGPSERQLAGLPKVDRTEFTINEATAYPPLYYKIGSWFYDSAYWGNIFDRVFSVRLFTGLIGVLTFIVVYLIGKVLYKGPLKQISLAILTSFAPMFMYVNSGVTSDSLFNLIFPLFLLNCLFLIKKGLNIAGLVGIGLVFLLGIYTKPQANIMAFVFTPLLLVLFLRSKRKALLFPVIVIALAVVFEEVIRRIISGLSIFPEAGSVKFSVQAIMEHFQFTFNHTYREILPWYWGVFRWLSLALPSFLRQITNVLTIGSFVSFIAYLIFLFKNKKFSQEFLLKAFMFSALLIYFLALTAFDYGFRQAHGFSFGIQGRYFFPVAVVVSMIIIDGMGFLFERFWKGIYLLALDLGFILFNVFVFFYLMFTYYAKAYPLFFIQASQYKPVWLKYPVNLVILVGFLVGALMFASILVKTYAKKVTD